MKEATSPEEFEKLFKDSLGRNEIKDKRKVFILDDLDRCNNKKVLEVLAGISTFLDEEKCIYIIPCDAVNHPTNIAANITPTGEEKPRSAIVIPLKDSPGIVFVGTSTFPVIAK